ncbi:MAG: MerR family transcriptional regulator [Chitinophagaceae bacterium]
MFLINQVAKLSKVSIPTIRLYEKHGLIKGKKNSGVRNTQYTYYDAETIERIELIEECRSVGMSFTEVTKLIKVWYGQRISNARRSQILHEKLEILHQKSEKIKDIQHRVNLLLNEIKKFS